VRGLGIPSTKFFVGDKAKEFAISLGNFTVYLVMKTVMRVAYKVLENTKHTLLVGDKATEFAISLCNFIILLYTKKLVTQMFENKTQPPFAWETRPQSLPSH
jgi:hypothetical protein